MKLEEQLEAIFRETLEIEGPINREELQYNKFAKWDSLAHMTLVAAIESKFDCILDTDDVLDMSSFDKAIAIVRKYRDD